MPCFVEIGSPVPEKKILKGFYHIWAWRPSWSCDLDYLYIHWLTHPIDVSHKKFALIGQVLEYYGDIHVYCLVVGAYEPTGSFFQNH